MTLLYNLPEIVRYSLYLETKVYNIRLRFCTKYRNLYKEYGVINFINNLGFQYDFKILK